MTIFFKLYFLLLFVLQSLLLTVAILKDAFLDSQNSDLLYAPLLLLDITDSFRSLSEWNLTPAPYFFPDLLLYYPFHSLDIGIALFVYNLLFSGIWFALLWRVFQDYYMVCFLFFFVGFVFFLSGKLIYFFTPTHHSSLYLFGFYLISVIKTSQERKESSLEFQKDWIHFLSIPNPAKLWHLQTFPVGTQLGILGVLFLYGMSDMQIILQIFLPFCIYEILIVFRNPRKLREILMFYFILGVAVSLGNLFLNHLHQIKILKIPQIPVFKTWIFYLKQGLFWQNLSLTRVSFLEEAKEFYFFYIFLFLGYGLLFLVRQRLQFLLPHAKTLWITFLLSVLVIFLFQGSFGVWMGYRYIWFYYLFPLLFLGLEVSFFLREILFRRYKGNFIPFSLSRISLFWGMGVLSLLVLSFEINSLAPDLQKIGSFYISPSTPPTASFKSLRPGSLKFRPNFIQCLSNLQTTHSLSKGVSDYWMSKYIQYFSQNQIVTHQVSSDLKTYAWINNSSIQDEREEFSFLILNNLPKTLVLKRLGAPDQKEICDAKEIWIYKAKFSYFQLHAEQREKKL
jgi:hypothetical protein